MIIDTNKVDDSYLIFVEFDLGKEVTSETKTDFINSLQQVAYDQNGMAGHFEVLPNYELSRSVLVKFMRCLSDDLHYAVEICPENHAKGLVVQFDKELKDCGWAYKIEAGPVFTNRPVTVVEVAVMVEVLGDRPNYLARKAAVEFVKDALPDFPGDMKLVSVS